MGTADADPATPVTDVLNQLLGAYWTAAAQHQTHVALLDAWGIAGLARRMDRRIVDEPVTIKAVLARLLDLGGTPTFTLGTPRIGATLGEILANDVEAQRLARPALNAAAEVAGAAHDATTRVLLEGVLADEERHLSWLETEIELLERLGEPLYVANRLGAPAEQPAG